MPKTTFTITGEIADFGRVDNVYTTLKREGQKLLKNWTITVNVDFEEKQVPVTKAPSGKI